MEAEDQQYNFYQPQPPSQDATISSMRWEAQKLILDMYEVLGGYHFVNTGDGEVKPVRRNEKIKPKMNDEGIESMISIIQSKVNPISSLTNIDDMEANLIIRQTLYMIIKHLLYNQERYQIDDGDLELIMDNLKGIVFFQVKRAVGGHESRNYRTQSIEQSQSLTTENKNKQGWSLIPGGRK